MNNIIVASCIFIAFDFISGFIGALKNKNLNSTKLREGLFHKCAFAMLIVLAFVLEYYEHLITSNIIPLVVPVCTYVIITEVTSILENIQKINPNILPDKVSNLFLQFTNKDGE